MQVDEGQAPHDDTADPSQQLIVIGSSAGGIEALSVLVAGLPADLPVPVLIAQHLDPHRPSHLVEILQRRTGMPVRTAEGVQALGPGTILVVPPNRNAEVTDHAVRVVEIAEGLAKPSIDGLLTSAASAFGEGLIAVILTGTGSDGAVGARAVKVAGGTIVIQNPQTASYPDMPQSIAPSIVDIVADLEAIAPLLRDLVTGAYDTPRPDEERLLGTFLEQLRERSGIDFSTYKRATIRRRLQRRMAATNSTTLRAYTRYVQKHPEEVRRLTSAFLIKVTEFFRDADLFGYLRDRVIPTLIDDARSRGNELRLWSAGCATGEEAYSLAILVADALGEELAHFNARIFATDLDLEAINFARRGVYAASTLEGVPQDVVERHFTAKGDHFEVTKRIRAMTVFGQHDLGQRAPFPRVDLALCRNVLIYFTPDLQSRALQLFAFSLRDNGYLALGKAESTTPLPDYFVPEEPRLKVYRRRGERVVLAPARIRDTTPLTIRPLVARRARWPEPPAAVDRSRPSTTSERAEDVLLRLPVGVVLVNRHYDIQSINAAARRMLAIHGPAIGDDFVHMLPAPATNDVRSMVDRAFLGEAATTVLELPVAALGESEARTLQIGCHPVLNEADPAHVEAVLILASDVTVAVRVRSLLEEELHDERADKGRLAEQARLLTRTNAELLDANQELTTANAELRSSNEELLVANEEVQAATEEVETLNEELQATNEELETLNEELQATVEELNTTNDDLQARGVELQESATAMADQRDSFEGERNRLVAMLDALPEAIAFVASDGAIVVSNEVYRSLLADGQPIDAKGQPLVERDWPIERAARGEQSNVELRVGPAGERWSVETRPVRVDGSVGGLVVGRRIE